LLSLRFSWNLLCLFFFLAFVFFPHDLDW
jgi:hypothetical protein